MFPGAFPVFRNGAPLRGGFPGGPRRDPSRAAPCGDPSPAAPQGRPSRAWGRAPLRALDMAHGHRTWRRWRRRGNGRSRPLLGRTCGEERPGEPLEGSPAGLCGSVREKRAVHRDGFRAGGRLRRSDAGHVLKQPFDALTDLAQDAVHGPADEGTPHRHRLDGRGEPSRHVPGEPHATGHAAGHASGRRPQYPRRRAPCARRGHGAHPPRGEGTHGGIGAMQKPRGSVPKCAWTGGPSVSPLPGHFASTGTIPTSAPSGTNPGRGMACPFEGTGRRTPSTALPTSGPPPRERRAALTAPAGALPKT